MERKTEDALVVAAARAGDQAAFGVLVERHRRELQVHCYRMLGSFEDSEDLVQETFLRAWRKRASFEGRSTFRAWLYRIATNVCLDFLDRHPRHPLPRQPMPDQDWQVSTPPAAIPWLQPYPDQLLEPIAPSDAEPDAALVAKETIELAFLAAIQHLPPRQRAVLILRDVLGWSANETAALLEVSVASVKSALQRARPTLKQHLPERRLDWAPSSNPTTEERALLQRYMDSTERADIDTLAALLREDTLLTMPPHPMWFVGRASILAFTKDVFDPASPMYHGEWRCLPTWANRKRWYDDRVRSGGHRAGAHSGGRHV
ncbi:MAG TPA: RNA polymerase subunit sigma-70 [Roseiflexaceae bacterium]|nr:RNA polymerase subunit sigma-70 [Roseiflexaceae bacterium]